MKLLRASCEQIAYLESLLLSTGTASRVLPSGSNVPLWEIQRQFKPVVYQNEYDVVTGGFFPVRVKFDYNSLQNIAHISMKRKGLDRLRQLLPDVFDSMGDVGSPDEEGEFEIKVDMPRKVATPQREAEGDGS